MSFVISSFNMSSCELCMQLFDNITALNQHKLKKHPNKKSYGNPLFTTVKPPKQGKPKDYIDLSNFVELFKQSP